MTPTDLETLRRMKKAWEEFQVRREKDDDDDAYMDAQIELSFRVDLAVPALTALLADYEQMREWITEKAWHGIGCNRHKKYHYRSGKRIPHDGSCDCGFDALRATLKGEKNE